MTYSESYLHTTQQLIIDFVRGPFQEADNNHSSQNHILRRGRQTLGWRMDIKIWTTRFDLSTGKGKQFTAKFFQDVCRSLNWLNLHKAAYHAQNTFEVVPFDRKILSTLRTYILYSYYISLLLK